MWRLKSGLWVCRFRAKHTTLSFPTWGTLCFSCNFFECQFPLLYLSDPTWLCGLYMSGPFVQSDMLWQQFQNTHREVALSQLWSVCCLLLEEIYQRASDWHSVLWHHYFCCKKACYNLVAVIDLTEFCPSSMHLPICPAPYCPNIRQPWSMTSYPHRGHTIWNVYIHFHGNLLDFCKRKGLTLLPLPLRSPNPRAVMHFSFLMKCFRRPKPLLLQPLILWVSWQPLSEWQYISTSFLQTYKIFIRFNKITSGDIMQEEHHAVSENNHACLLIQ